jgi:hypothetical protein
MPYLAVSNARLERLKYGQDGAIDYLQPSITVLAVNNNSKADASFSSMDLILGFHSTDVALLRAQPFAVPRESSMPQRRLGGGGASAGRRRSKGFPATLLRLARQKKCRKKMLWDQNLIFWKSFIRNFRKWYSFFLPVLF